jgi:hypothetical protein
MSNWVKGTNFPDHFVNEEDPTVQVVVVGDPLDDPDGVVAYSLPKDYTILDQLYDSEADNSLVSPVLRREAVRAVRILGEHLARKVVIIDNTQNPPRILQIPDEDAGLLLPDPPFQPLKPSPFNLRELYE